MLISNMKKKTQLFLFELVIYKIGSTYQLLMLLHKQNLIHG